MTNDRTTAETELAPDAARVPLVQPVVEPPPNVAGAGRQAPAKQPEGQAPEEIGADRRMKQENPAERKAKPRPKTLLELLEYAYLEPGKKLDINKQDLRAVAVDAVDADAEERFLLQHATQDLTLAVPAKLLTALADLAQDSPVMQPRLLQLVLGALVSHPVFRQYGAALIDSSVEPAPDAERIIRAVDRLSRDPWWQENAESLKGKRSVLTSNAITAFLLLRVLRDGWPLGRVIDEVLTPVRVLPTSMYTAPNAVALTAAQTSTALAVLTNHFEQKLASAQHETGLTCGQLVRETRRADTAERVGGELSSQLEAVQENVLSLQSTVAALEARVREERSDRVADKSHLIDDYEMLRTRTIRRLSDQVQLLSDGLHALRHGSHAVAEEFLDRALTAIQNEVAKLRESDGGSR